MTACCPATPGASAPPAAAPSAAGWDDRDHALRWPVLLLLGSALLWLVAGSLAYVMAFVKLHAPGMMAGAAPLTYGRLHPAATNALLYGFASQAGLAVALWMICRLGRAPLALPGFALLGWFVWNLVLPVGLGGILLGDTTGFEWFELPRYVSPALFFAHAFIAVSGLVTLGRREEPMLYVSHWFLLLALFVFPWVWSVGHLLLAFHPVRGVVQAGVHAWAVNGVATLWLAPLALAMIYYFIPKLTGRPLYSRGLALIGFWTLAGFGAWAGLRAGMPLPAWIVSASVAAGVSLLVPLVANAANWSHTLSGTWGRAWQDLPLRFILAAAGSYVAWSGLGVITSARGVSRLTQFTYVTTAHHVWLLFGVMGLAVSGAIYHLVPHLARREFGCARAPRFHFWGALSGLLLAEVGLLVGGLVQGIGLANPDKTMIEIVRSTKPWLQLSAAGLLILAVAQVFLAANFIGLLVQTARVSLNAWCRPVFAPVVAPAFVGGAHRAQAAPASVPAAPAKPTALPPGGAHPVPGRQGKKRKRR